MLRQLTKIIAFVISTWTVFPTYGFSDEDSFRKALEFTYMNNPDLVMARKSLDSTNELLVQARSNLYPSASLSTSTQRSYSSNNNDFDTVTDTSTIRIAGEYILYSGGRITSNINASKEEIRVARFNLRSQEQQVLLSSIKVYLDVIRDRKLTEISENNLKVIGEQVDATRNRFALGSATRTDLAEREAAFAAAKAEHSAREGALSASEEIYETQIGLAPGQMLSEPDTVSRIPSSLDIAIEIGLTENPLILGSMAKLIQSREKYKQLRASRGINITVSGALQNSDSSVAKGNSGNIGISASIPIFSGGNLVSKQRQGALSLESSQIQLRKQRRIVEQNIEISWNNLEVSKSTVKARVLQVEASGLAYDGIRKEFDLGARSNLEISVSEQNLLKARSDLASAQRDVKYAAYSLLASMGKLDILSLNLNVEPFDPELEGPIITPMKINPDNLEVGNNPFRAILNNLGSLID